MAREFKNMEGQRVPDVTFRTRQGSEWVDVTSKELFNGRTVIVFSLPGAFTPTCSSSHVPRYDQLATTFEASGVDEVICVSVNDAFVMNEWQAQQCAQNVRFIPDGTGEFTKGMGMLVNRADLGFGYRSWRYSMLVRDGVVEKMFIEPDEPGDPFHVSDADTMLAHVAPEGTKPLDVALMTRPGCSYCENAKAMLAERGIEFAELVLHRDYTQQALRAMSGKESFPQVFIDGKYIGDSEDLETWFAERAAA